MGAFSTMQKIAIWILILAGVFVLSDFLINVGLNSTYQNIQRADDNSQIIVYQADATYVNGRIRGLIKRDTKPIKGKYVKVELYSKREVLVGKSYIELKDLEEDETQPFELLFKAKDVAFYNMEVVDKKEAGDELEIVPRELTKPEIVLTTAIMFLVFWA